MRFPNDTHPGQWWPVSPHGNAPEVFPRSLVSLSPDVPSAIYCWSTRGEQAEEGDVLNWHVLAIAGQSLIELHGAGPEGSAEEREREVRTTRGYRFSVTEPWTVTWLLELTSGEVLTLPEPGAESRSQIADAERLAAAVLQHLQER